MKRLKIAPLTKPMRAVLSSLAEPPSVKLFGALTTRFSRAKLATKYQVYSLAADVPKLEHPRRDLPLQSRYPSDMGERDRDEDKREEDNQDPLQHIEQCDGEQPSKNGVGGDEHCIADIEGRQIQIGDE